MSRILAVGIATLDIINSVEDYPQEDDEIRAVSQRICRGGNATNTLVVLSQLGHQCHWAGVLVDEPDTRHIEAELNRYRINCDAVMQLGQGKVPTSYITHNLRNGTRSIIHHRDLREYPFERFAQIDLAAFDWLHFEGRNIDDCAKMLKHARKTRPDLRISLEIEKERPGIEQLFGLADVLIFSRAFAQARGYAHAEVLLQALAPELPDATLICAWGEQGAWSMQRGICCHSAAFPPEQVIDTLAAGDTFNAGIIHALVQDQPMAKTLQTACRLAGTKCGHLGLDFIQQGHSLHD